MPVEIIGAILWVTGGNSEVCFIQRLHQLVLCCQKLWKDSNAVSGIQLQLNTRMNLSVFCCIQSLLNIPWVSCWTTSSCCRRIWGTCRSRWCVWQLCVDEWDTQGISNGTRCVCMSAASHECPVSVLVAIWTLGPHVDLYMQTSTCRHLHPSL